MIRVRRLLASDAVIAHNFRQSSTDLGYPRGGNVVSALPTAMSTQTQHFRLVYRLNLYVRLLIDQVLKKELLLCDDPDECDFSKGGFFTTRKAR